MYLMSLSYTLRNDYNGKVYVYLPQLRKKKKKLFLCPNSKAEEGPITKPTKPMEIVSKELQVNFHHWLIETNQCF